MYVYTTRKQYRINKYELSMSDVVEINKKFHHIRFLYSLPLFPSPKRTPKAMQKKVRVFQTRSNNNKKILVKK